MASLLKRQTYPAAHGWMMPGIPVYRPWRSGPPEALLQADADRGWTELLAIINS